MPANTDAFDGPYDAHGARVSDEGTLKILNSNRGIRNSIPKDDFFSMMNKVFQEVADNLTAHCGPYSRSALVVSPSGGKYETNVFTKDGRNIVASMNFVSPIEEIIKEMLLYIGSRVDNKAGDGTTSSMYIASRFFSLMSKHFKDKIVNSLQFSNEYKTFEEKLLASLDKQKITLDQLYQDMQLSNHGKDLDKKTAQSLVGAIAAIQTLSSSGGDMELAKCMYEIYKQSPKGTWDYVSVYHQKWESSAKYAVENEPYDHWLSANILTNGMLNENLFSEYKDTVDLLVLPQEVPGGGVLADEVETYLKSIFNDNRDRTLVIFCRSLDATILRMVQNHNSHNTHFKICVFEHLDELTVTAVSMGLIGLSLCGGKDPFMVGKTGVTHLTDDYLITDVDVHYKNHKLYIDRLYDQWVEDESDPCHPFYSDPDKFRPYTYFLKSLEKRLAALKDDINQTQYRNEIDNIQNQIARMCFPRRPYLLVGGASHDHAEAIDVIRDCAGAINSALTDGFVCGSSLALIRAMRPQIDEIVYKNAVNPLALMVNQVAIELAIITMYGRYPEDIQKEIDSHGDYVVAGTDANKYIPGRAIDDLATLRKCYMQDREDSDSLMDQFYKHFNQSEERKYEYINILERTSHTEPDPFGTYVLRDYRTMAQHLMQHPNQFFSECSKSYPIVQPAKVFEQLFARIGELMIKLITTERVIVPGAVYIKEDDDK